MLAKRKAAKKSAIAAHSSALSSTVSASAPAVKGGKKKRDAKSVVSAAAAAGRPRRPVTRADVQDVSTEMEKVDLIRSIGDDINTRLLNMHANAGDDDIDDAVLHEERKYQLMEEARLAAGMQQRVVSSHIEAFYSTTAAAADRQEDRLALVRVKHNCNAITAVTALGLDVLVLGDKSGKVYMVDLQSMPDAPSLFASQRTDGADDGKRNGSRGHATASASAASSSPAAQVDLAAYKRKKKIMLEPALPRAIVSLAISDTRGNRPTTRDIFEKTTVDHSCPSYTVAGAEDGSIAVWETFTQKHKGLLFMHHKAVTGLCFRTGTADLYSASDDGTLRVWSVPQMMSVDKLFGHEGKVHDLRALKKETCATVGDDGTMRFWKIDAATQQSYTYTVAQREEALAAAVAMGEFSILHDNGVAAAAAAAATPGASAGKALTVPIQLECVAMLNESTVLCGAVDGSLVLFDVNKRKPLTIVPAAHGFDALQDGTGLEKTALQTDRREENEELSAKDAADAAVRALLGGPSAAAAASGKAKGKGTKAAATAAVPQPARVYDRRRIANPIAAVAAVPYADVVASASYDGVVRLWRVRGLGGVNTGAGRRTPLGPAVTGAGEAAAPQTPRLSLLTELPMRALVTSLHFSPDGDCLYVACSKECRRGRWTVYRAAQNGVAVVPLTAGGAERFSGPASVSGGGRSGPSVLSIEHVPAQLYSLQDDDADEDGAEREGSAQEELAAEKIGKKATSGADFEVESFDDGSDADTAGVLPVDNFSEEEGEMEGSLAGPSGKAAGGHAAFFTVGSDGQLVFSSSAAAGAAGDVMKAQGSRPATSQKKVLKRKQKKVVLDSDSKAHVSSVSLKQRKEKKSAAPLSSDDPRSSKAKAALKKKKSKK